MMALDRGSCWSVSIIRSRIEPSNPETAYPLFTFRSGHGRHRLQIDRDRAAVRFAELGGVLDDLGHAAADLIEIRGRAAGQHRYDVVGAPIADPGLAIRGNVRRFAVIRRSGRRSGQEAMRIGRAE